MMKQNLNLWQFLVVEPYTWLTILFGNTERISQSVPEEMTTRRYIQYLLRVAVPFFSVLYLFVVISFPFVSLWNGQDVPSPYPFAKIAVVCGLVEATALVGGYGCALVEEFFRPGSLIFRTQLGFMIMLALTLPGSMGLALAIVGF